MAEITTTLVLLKTKNRVRAGIICLVLSLAFFSCFNLKSQDLRIPLYTGKIPNSKPNKVKEKFDNEYKNALTGITVPDIAVYRPTREFSTGRAVLIFPGGGYWIESIELEGRDIARYLTTIGITAIVVKYRLPSDELCLNKHEVPLMDAKRAMRIVRAHAAEWNIDSQKIGVIGFSAGGHLASTLGTHFDYGNKSSLDTIEHFSSRPNFMALIYPVISLKDSVTHPGSRKQLLGNNPPSKLIEFYSSELQVKEDTPPTFIVHATDDKVVGVQNSLLMYRALKEKNIPTEMHILSEGGHGFGLASKSQQVGYWTTNLKLWLESLQ
jgi:acetyl esterase/lipase